MMCLDYVTPHHTHFTHTLHTHTSHTHTHTLQVIQKYSSREISHNKIVELEKSLSELSAKKEELAKVLDLKKKQFHLLVHCVHQLQDELQADDVAMDT